MTVCAIEDCGRPIKRADLCKTHYERFLRTGVRGGPIHAIVPKGAECTVDQCHRAPMARGMCQTHYGRSMRGEPLGEIRQRWVSGETCSIDGCDGKPVGRTWCGNHYQHWQNHGHPTEKGAAEDGRGLCVVPGCGKRLRYQDYCQGHYAQVRRGVTELVNLREIGDPAARDERGRKQCRRCKTWLDVSSFTMNKARSDGLTAYCRRCEKDKGLISQFGIGIVDYEEMLEAQGGGCAICGIAPTERRGLVVDHDHGCCATKLKTCGKCVRALLCVACNSGLGQFYDSPELLEAAAQYLATHGARR